MVAYKRQGINNLRTINTNRGRSYKKYFNGHLQTALQKIENASERPVFPNWHFICSNATPENAAAVAGAQRDKVANHSCAARPAPRAHDIGALRATHRPVDDLLPSGVADMKSASLCSIGGGYCGSSRRSGQLWRQPAILCWSVQSTLQQSQCEIVITAGTKCCACVVKSTTNHHLSCLVIRQIFDRKN